MSPSAPSDPERFSAMGLSKKDYPYSLRYAAVGAILGLGSPYGLLTLRALNSFDRKLLAWLSAELDVMIWIYLYTGVGSVFVFTLFGYLLGKREDELRKHTEKVEASARNLKTMSITDGLTNLYVHSHTLTRLDEEFLRAKRYNYSLGCLFIDIDQFKDMNDRHGHLLGDRVLMEIARALAKEVRDTDILGRYGGDEFLAILPETDTASAYKVAERVRKSVEALNLESNGEAIRVTISIGVFAASSLPNRTQDILVLADTALRQAKNLGKNRSVLFAADKPRPPSL